MLNLSSLQNGQEQHESFKHPVRRNQTLVQYDYRHTNGHLFSCVKPTLEQCRQARDIWVQK